MDEALAEYAINPRLVLVGQFAEHIKSFQILVELVNPTGSDDD